MNKASAVVLSVAVGLTFCPVESAGAVKSRVSTRGYPLAAEDHAGHKHEEHAETGRSLGSKELAGYTVTVTQESDVKAGKEAVFAIALSGKKDKPKAVRAWVGVESAEGSVKGKAVPEGAEFHAHVESPDPIPAKSQFWVEIEIDGGKKKVAFDYR